MILEISCQYLPPPKASRRRGYCVHEPDSAVTHIWSMKHCNLNALSAGARNMRHCTALISCPETLAALYRTTSPGLHDRKLLLGPRLLCQLSHQVRKPLAEPSQSPRLCGRLLALFVMSLYYLQAPFGNSCDCLLLLWHCGPSGMLNPILNKSRASW